MPMLWSKNVSLNMFPSFLVILRCCFFFKYLQYLIKIKGKTHTSYRKPVLKSRMWVRVTCCHHKLVWLSSTQQEGICPTVARSVPPTAISERSHSTHTHTRRLVDKYKEGKLWCLQSLSDFSELFNDEDGIDVNSSRWNVRKAIAVITNNRSAVSKRF